MLRTHAPRVTPCPPQRTAQLAAPRTRVLPVVRADASSGDAILTDSVDSVDTAQRTAQNNVQPIPQRWYDAAPVEVLLRCLCAAATSPTHNRSGHRNTKQLVARRQQELDQRRFYMQNQWCVVGCCLYDLGCLCVHTQHNGFPVWALHTHHPHTLGIV